MGLFSELSGGSSQARAGQQQSDLFPFQNMDHLGLSYKRDMLALPHSQAIAPFTTLPASKSYWVVRLCMLRMWQEV